MAKGQVGELAKRRRRRHWRAASEPSSRQACRVDEDATRRAGWRASRPPSRRASRTRTRAREAGSIERLVIGRFQGDRLAELGRRRYGARSMARFQGDEPVEIGENARGEQQAILRDDGPAELRGETAARRAASKPPSRQACRARTRTPRGRQDGELRDHELSQLGRRCHGASSMASHRAQRLPARTKAPRRGQHG